MSATCIHILMRWDVVFMKRKDFFTRWLCCTRDSRDWLYYYKYVCWIVSWIPHIYLQSYRNAKTNFCLTSKCKLRGSDLSKVAVLSGWNLYDRKVLVIVIWTSDWNFVIFSRLWSCVFEFIFHFTFCIPVFRMATSFRIQKLRSSTNGFP